MSPYRKNQFIPPSINCITKDFFSTILRYKLSYSANFANSYFTSTVMSEETYLGSVIRRISLQRRPMKVADSSTEGNLGIGMWVDWCTLCQSWIWREARNKPISQLLLLRNSQTTRTRPWLIDKKIYQSGTNCSQCTTQGKGESVWSSTLVLRKLLHSCSTL